MRRFSEWLIRVSTGWVALAASLTFVLFMILVMPGQAADADTGADDVGSPDLSLYYAPNELYQMAEAYGEAGRASYIRARFTFDLVWPLVYTFFLVTTTSWLISYAFAAGSRWRYANLVPVFAMLLDYLENISTSLVMYRYPDPLNVAAYLAPLFTLLKWIMVGGSFALLPIGCVAAFWRWNRQRRQAANGNQS